MIATAVMDFNNPYMQWYQVITWCFITPLLHQDLMRFHSTASTIKLLVRQFGIQNHFQIKVNLIVCKYLMFHFLIQINIVIKIVISTNLEDNHRIAIIILRTVREGHRIHLPSLIRDVGAPPTSGGG